MPNLAPANLPSQPRDMFLSTLGTYALLCARRFGGVKINNPSLLLTVFMQIFFFGTTSLVGWLLSSYTSVFVRLTLSFIHLLTHQFNCLQVLPLTGVITDAATGKTRKVFHWASLCPAFITVNGTRQILTKVYGGLNLDVLSNLVWSHAPVELQDKRLLHRSSALGLCNI